MVHQSRTDRSSGPTGIQRSGVRLLPRVGRELPGRRERFDLPRRRGVCRLARIGPAPLPLQRQRAPAAQWGQRPHVHPPRTHGAPLSLPAALPDSGPGGRHQRPDRAGAHAPGRSHPPGVDLPAHGPGHPYGAQPPAPLSQHRPGRACQPGGAARLPVRLRRAL